MKKGAKVVIWLAFNMEYLITVFINIAIDLETAYLTFLKPLGEGKKVVTALFHAVDFSDQEEYSC